MKTITKYYRLLVGQIRVYALLVLGPQYHVKLASLFTSLLVSGIDLLVTGGKPTLAIFFLTWGKTIKDFWQANVVGKIADNQPLAAAKTPLNETNTVGIFK